MAKPHQHFVNCGDRYRGFVSGARAAITPMVALPSLFKYPHALATLPRDHFWDGISRSSRSNRRAA